MTNETKQTKEKEGGLACKLVDAISPFDVGKGIIYSKGDNQYLVALNGKNLPDLAGQVYREGGCTEQVITESRNEIRDALTYASQEIPLIRESKGRVFEWMRCNKKGFGYEMDSEYVGFHANIAKRVGAEKIFGGFHYIVPVIEGKPTMVIHSSSEKYGRSPRIAQIEGLPEGMEYIQFDQKENKK